MTDQKAVVDAFMDDLDRQARDKFRALGLPDTPFLLVAISPPSNMLVRANLEAATLKQIAVELVEAADNLILQEASDGRAN